MSLFPDLPPKNWPGLYLAGSSLAQIADRTGYPATRVRLELLARGVVLRRPGARRGSRQRSSDWHVTAAMMRAHGYRYAAIARELGQSPAAVRSALVRQAEDDVGHHRAYLARMRLFSDQSLPTAPPEKP